MFRPFWIAGAIALVTAPAAASAKPALDLEQLVAEARRRHPETTRARARVAAKREVPSRVGALPDPVFVSSISNLRLDELSLGGHPMTGIALGLSQQIPFPGKLSRRERVAEADARVAAFESAAVTVDVELAVRIAYWQLYYAERALEILTRNERVLNTLTNAVHARFGVGQGAQQDALQAQVAHSRVRALLTERAEAVVSSRRALNSAVGRPPDRSLSPTAPPPSSAPLKPRVELVELARRNNPAIAIGGGGVDLALHTLAEARRDRWPDFAVSLGYRLRAAAPGDASEGADMVSLTLGVTLPIWAGRKQDARVRQQAHEVSRARAALAARTLEVTTRIERAVDALERLDEQLALYARELLPQADQALDASIVDYQVGKVGFVSVLSNWRTELEIQLNRERLIAERQQRRATLRALVGADITRGKP